MRLSEPALPATVSAAARAAAARLAAYWDALGWVYFRKGELDRAREYALAAWQTSGRAEMADRLGQIEEARKDLVAAAKYYAFAMATPSWRPLDRIDRYNRLVPLADRDRLQKEVLSTEMDRLEVPALGGTPGRTNVELLIGLDGIIRDARGTTSDPSIQEVIRAMVDRKVIPGAPGDPATRLYRTGVVTCGETQQTCTLIVYVTAGTTLVMN